VFERLRLLHIATPDIPCLDPGFFTPSMETSRRAWTPCTVCVSVDRVFAREQVRHFLEQPYDRITEASFIFLCSLSATRGNLVGIMDLIPWKKSEERVRN
jgi:hypothetical protein